MRLFFALLLLFFVVPSRGQEACFNPDLSNDGVVGSADLVLLLSYYDLTWPLDSGLSCEASITHQGHEYGVVQIGEQCWFAENCRYLPAVSLPSSMNWAPHAFVLDYAGADVAAAMATTAYADYGVLYNWHAFTQWDLCPAGWHMATDSDWFAMEAAIGVEELELETTGFRGDHQGEQLKDSVMWNGTDDHGMAFLPGGQTFTNGTFGNEGVTTHIWTATEFSTLYPWHRGFMSGSDGVYRNNNVAKSVGGYGRCVME